MRSEPRAPDNPNILVTGTPGVGKSTFCAALAQNLGLRHINVGQFAAERELMHSYDEKMDYHYLHEDAVLDALEPIMTDGGVVIDHHSSDWFPERWIQLVVVLRASTHILFDRLAQRNYPDKKRNENMEAEIMQVVLDEAKESYPQVTLFELVNDTLEDAERNLQQVGKEYQRISLQLPEATDIR